jgi:Survival protein SurE
MDDIADCTGNLGVVVPISGTAGAASAAADQLSIPGIAFSGSTGSQTAWTVSPVPDYVPLYANLAANLTTTLLESGTPYLPSGIWLNVNFPGAGSGTSCTQSSQFKFVLSKIYASLGMDVVTCNNDGWLPTESKVVGTSGCYASVSVGKASDKMDADEEAQAAVLSKLSGILTCLPS